MVKRYIFLVLTVIWMIGIFRFSAKSADESTEDSLEIGRMVCSIVVSDYDELSEEEQLALAEQIDHPVRKCAHATEYAILGILMLQFLSTFPMEDRRLIVLAIGLSVLYAASDEFHQLFVPGRSGQISDVGIDSIGVFAGTIISKYIYKEIEQWKI